MTKIIQSFGLGQHFAGYCLLFICLFAFFTGNLIGATIFVGPPPTLIQTAIDIAAAGDTIQLSPGTYIEEIEVISKSLNIVGAGENSTTIQAPPPTSQLTQIFNFAGINFYCIVMIDNQAAPTPQTVNISDLTVDGDSQQDAITPTFYGNSNRFFAIGYHNAGGTIQNVHTTNTKQSSSFNELAGGGIICAANTGTATCNVTDCLIDFYQRSGIDCRGAALTVNVINTTINRGFFLTPNTSTATPNGLQFSGSTTGSIINNVVEGNIGTVAQAGASGIIVVGAGPNLIVSGNTVNNNDNGIAAVDCGNNLTISNNTINFTIPSGVNPPEGIIVQDTDGLSTITSNIMNNIPFINMEILSTLPGLNPPFQLMDNQFIGSQTGILVTGDDTAGPVITMNGDSFTGTRGYYIQEVTAPNGAPNNIWPSTATVSFDGLISGHITMAQFNQILTKIYDQHNDPALGLVLAFLAPLPSLPPSNFIGTIRKNKFLNDTEYLLTAQWEASPSTDVVLYRIYKNGHLVDEVSAGSPLVFVVYLDSEKSAKGYQVVSVNTNNLESTPTSIRIVHE
jgi:parallel beta-helix repeat protein